MSIQQEMLEIREADRTCRGIGMPLKDRIMVLNGRFDDWVFTRQGETDKIDANRIGDLFGKPIEV